MKLNYDSIWCKTKMNQSSILSIVIVHRKYIICTLDVHINTGHGLFLISIFKLIEIAITCTVYIILQLRYIIESNRLLL